MDGIQLSLNGNPTGPGPSQTFNFKIITIEDFKGSVHLDYNITDLDNKHTSTVAAVDLPDYIFLDYDDEEFFSAVVSNIPSGATYTLTIIATSGSISDSIDVSGHGMF